MREDGPNEWEAPSGLAGCIMHGRLAYVREERRAFCSVS